MSIQMLGIKGWKTAARKLRTVIFEVKQQCNENVVNQVKIQAVSKQAVPESDDVTDVLKVARKQYKQPSTEYNNNYYNYYY